jgi:DNA-binding transcriptional LysR family regulator
MISASVRRLTVFKAVAETGKFSDAAAALGIAQPSVSAHVKALERQAGQPLFIRSPGRAPRLTLAGEAVYGYALDVVRRSAETETRLGVLSAERPIEITVAAQRSLAHGALAADLASFVHAHPEAKLVTHSETGERVIALLHAQEVDIGISGAGRSRDYRPSHRHRELTLVAAPDHPLAKRAVSPASLDYGSSAGITGSHFARSFPS